MYLYYNCDLDSFEKLLHIDEIKDEYDVIKELFEEGNSTKIVKEKNDFIKESLEKMKEKAESLKDDPGELKLSSNELKDFINRVTEFTEE